MTIYVGNLSFDAEAEDVQHLFSQYGQVSKCSLPLDRDTGRKRGFAFVEMADGRRLARKEFGKGGIISSIKDLDPSAVVGIGGEVNTLGEVVVDLNSEPSEEELSQWYFMAAKCKDHPLSDDLISAMTKRRWQSGRLIYDAFTAERRGRAPREKPYSAPVQEPAVKSATPKKIVEFDLPSEVKKKSNDKEKGKTKREEKPVSDVKEVSAKTASRLEGVEIIAREVLESKVSVSIGSLVASIPTLVSKLKSPHSTSINNLDTNGLDADDIDDIEDVEAAKT